MTKVEQVAVVAEMVLTWGATTWFLFALVGWDERRLARLAPQMLDRAWPIATKRAALVVLGPFALPLHFLRTRRSFRGILWAISSVVLVFLVEIAVGAVLECVLPVPRDAPDALPAHGVMDHVSRRETLFAYEALPPLLDDGVFAARPLRNRGPRSGLWLELGHADRPVG